MSIVWMWFLPAVALLWMPPVIPRALNESLDRDPDRPRSASIRGLLAAWPNWMDLLRSCGGVYLLMNLALVLDPKDRNAANLALALKAGVLIIGILAQTIRHKSGYIYLGPIFYLCGATLLLTDPATSIFAVSVSWLFAVAGGNVRAQMPVMGVVMAVGGYFLGANLPMLALNCLLIFLPLLIALMAGKQLLIVSLEHKPGASAH